MSLLKVDPVTGATQCTKCGRVLRSADEWSECKRLHSLQSFANPRDAWIINALAGAQQ